ncbi:MAG TPA: hypothetical protein DEF89_19570, partial [Desulfosporosinus sp.]|nr:hypothetical protein [Desulfosporosinus sp.]
MITNIFIGYSFHCSIKNIATAAPVETSPIAKATFEFAQELILPIILRNKSSNKPAPIPIDKNEITLIINHRVESLIKLVAVVTPQIPRKIIKPESKTSNEKGMLTIRPFNCNDTLIDPELKHDIF